MMFVFDDKEKKKKESNILPIFRTTQCKHHKEYREAFILLFVEAIRGDSVEFEWKCERSYAK